MLLIKKAKDLIGELKSKNQNINEMCVVILKNENTIDQMTIDLNDLKKTNSALESSLKEEKSNSLNRLKQFESLKIENSNNFIRMKELKVNDKKFNQS